MEEEINYVERFNNLLEIKPNYGYDRVKKPVKFNYIGLEIEVGVVYERERYTFIRTLIKQIKKLVDGKGYFTSDGTILGDYSFEIVLDPMSVPKIKKIYSTLLKIIKFSDGSLVFNKKHNCGLHMNFNQYDVTDLEEAHQRLLMLMNEKSEYFDENVYKRTVYNFSFKDYLDFQKEVASKYIAINYLNKKIVEVRNIKVPLSPGKLETIMNDILYCLFYDKLPRPKETIKSKRLRHLINKCFENDNRELLNKGLEEGLLIIKFDKSVPRIVEVDEESRKIYEGIGE